MYRASLPIPLAFRMQTGRHWHNKLGWNIHYERNSLWYNFTRTNNVLHYPYTFDAILVKFQIARGVFSLNIVSNGL